VLTTLAATDVTVLAAFGGGVVSFLSPCVLPIVPGYLSLVTGLSVGELRDREHDAARMARIVWMTLLFVAGFTAVFVGLGLAATTVGDTLFRNQETLTRLSGAVLVLFALYLAGSQVLMLPSVYREVRLQPHVERWGPVAAPVAGIAFGLGWTPCIGPVLGSVLTVAASSGETSRGAALLTAYSGGLGLSFLGAGLALGRLTGALSWFRRHGRLLTFVSAAVLLVFGVILMFDALPRLTARLQDVLDAIGLDRLIQIG